MTITNEYLDQILAPKLKEKGLNQKQTSFIKLDISTRLNSILSVWNNKNERASFLEMSREEAVNYEPKAPSLLVKMLVNSSIRNSVIEDLHADECYSQELIGEEKVFIDDDDIKEITIEAINFFNSKDIFTDLPSSEGISFSKSHPITYKAFLELSKISSGTTTYQPSKSEYIFSIEEKYDFNTNSVGKNKTVVLSGFDPRFDEYLSAVIPRIRKDKAIFFIPCFKFLTRNPLKLYDVFELILSSGASIATFNYYIENGFICKRYDFLPAPHSTDDVERQMKNKKGLSHKHKQAIKFVQKNT
ncbi:hypothetical protein [Endozoicomonas sp. 4G]|uniref:hypothetical protein n=1 Tax=Endozoicomonas sp. 4G TaxID=2872754 RepID=UPI0020790583|nr:hypothetical protein [Endozoicomonas sp. 4G]